MGPAPDPGLAPTARLRRGPTGAWAELDWIRARTCPVAGPALDVLEAHFRTSPGGSAFDSLGVPELPDRIRADRQLVDARQALVDGRARVVLGPAMYAIVPADDAQEPPTGLPMDVRGAGRRWHGLLRWLLGGDPEPDLNPVVDEFETLTAELAARGLLTPRVSGTTLGDLLPRRPYDQIFGMQRGTPLDRYYLLRFIDDTRTETTPAGRVLDIGGQPGNRVDYRLHGVRRWDTFDQNPALGPTIVGDVDDGSALAPATVDTVLLFNVLEHCAHPQRVVDNIHRWLRPGGTCLAMVPAAQRLHDFPADYGRPSPVSLAGWFAAYETVRPLTYGNLATAMGSLAGLAAEEFDEQTLAEQLPDFPVAVCVMARKAFGDSDQESQV